MSSASSLFARSLALACAAMVALSGCTGGDSKPTVSATPSIEVTSSASATPTPSTVPTERTTPTPSPTDAPKGDDPAPATTPAKLDATASISIAAVDPSTGDLVVGGYVTGVYEDGGTCIFTASPSSGATPLVVTTTGVANVDSTSCGSTTVPKDQVKAGTYAVVLTYQNSHGSTTSARITVKVNS